MEKRILNYRHYIDSLLNENPPDTNWNRILSEHLTQIAFFQHERLIHLIVTVTFAIITFIALSIYCIAEFFPVIALIVLLMVLLIPYIRHYYILENEVQKMYRQYDEIIKHIYSSSSNA